MCDMCACMCFHVCMDARIHMCEEGMYAEVSLCSCLAPRLLQPPWVEICLNFLNGDCPGHQVWPMRQSQTCPLAGTWKLSMCLGVPFSCSRKPFPRMASNLGSPARSIETCSKMPPSKSCSAGHPGHPIAALPGPPTRLWPEPEHSALANQGHLAHQQADSMHASAFLTASHFLTASAFLTLHRVGSTNSALQEVLLLDAEDFMTCVLTTRHFFCSQKADCVPGRFCHVVPEKRTRWEGEGGGYWLLSWKQDSQVFHFCITQ